MGTVVKFKRPKGWRWAEQPEGLLFVFPPEKSRVVRDLAEKIAPLTEREAALEFYKAVVAREHVLAAGKLWGDDLEAEVAAFARALESAIWRARSRIHEEGAA